MVNNILSIINLILVVTALVIAIVALTNHNKKDNFEDNLTDNDICHQIAAKFCRNQTQFCKKRDPSGKCTKFGDLRETCGDRFMKKIGPPGNTGRPDWECCQGADLSREPCTTNNLSDPEANVVCTGVDSTGDPTCIPGYYCAEEEECKPATLQNYHDNCHALDEGGTYLNQCYNSAPACKKYAKDCQTKKLIPLRDGTVHMSFYNQGTTGKGWTISNSQCRKENIQVMRIGDSNTNNLSQDETSQMILGGSKSTTDNVEIGCACWATREGVFLGWGIWCSDPFHPDICGKLRPYWIPTGEKNGTSSAVHGRGALGNFTLRVSKKQKNDKGEFVNDLYTYNRLQNVKTIYQNVAYFMYLTDFFYFWKGFTSCQGRA